MSTAGTKQGATEGGNASASIGATVASPISKVERGEASPERPSSRDSSSPENTCAICLGKPENKSFTDSCFHTFCFGCLAEWAKLKPECPLCKQRFKSIIHSVRSLEDYDQYFLSEEQHRTRSLYPTSFSADGPDGRRFRFPTTLTAERRQQLAMERNMQGLNQRATSASRVPRPGMPQREAGGRYGALTTTSAERRDLYDMDLWVSNNSTRYREASPQFYRDNPACMHRLIPWLNRELIALLGGNSSRITAVLELVLSLIGEVDIRHPDFFRHLYPSFGSRTQHFVHEFYAFATSVHDMVNYDRNAVYEWGTMVLARGTPIERYQAHLVESQRRAAELVSNARPRESSPRPGPSGVASRPPRTNVAVRAADGSDSDSSDCVIVSVVKPEERTPVVISLLSSSDEEDARVQSPPRRERVVSEERVTGTTKENLVEVDPPPVPPREHSASPPRARVVSFVSSGEGRTDSWTSDSDSVSSTSSADDRRASRKKKKEVRQLKLRSVVGSVVHRLSELGFHVGQRILDLLHVREKNYKRETKLLNILLFIKTSVWKTLFGKEADKLEQANEDDRTYYLIEKEPLVIKFISVPKDRGDLNCAAFVAGIIEAILIGCNFPAKVTAHWYKGTTFMIKFDESVIVRDKSLESR
ncbi:unnamed protein product [Ixodes hexagonus]